MLSALKNYYTENHYIVSGSRTTIRSIMLLDSEGELFFDDTYQREYVWTEEDEQNLLFSLLVAKIPPPALSVVLNENDDPSRYYEVIDGRQRITCILRFIKGFIGFKLPDGKVLLFKDMSKSDQVIFKSLTFNVNTLSKKDGSSVSYEDKVRFFYAVNFMGKDISLEHRSKVSSLIENF